MKTGIENRIIKIEDVEWEKLSFLQKPTLKSINKTQLDKLKESLKKNGYIQPCFVWENKEKIYCLDGYHRRLALLELRDEGHPVPSKLTGLFIQCKDMKDAAKKVLVYSSIYASVTDEGLYEFSHDFNLNFEEIKFEIDIPKLDLDRYEAGYVRDDGYNEEEDNAPEPPAEPTTKVGDLYLLGGRHRLLCGDSTKSEDVARLMDGKNAVLMNTDPPYGIDFVELSQSKGQSKSYTDIENDDLVDGQALQEFLEACIRVAVPHLIANCPFYLWHPMLTQGTFFAAAAAADIIINRQIIWVKPSFVFGRGDYHWKHELCFYGWRRGNKPVFYGERNQSTVWDVGRENDAIHPTQKPVELFKRPILNHTKPGEVVYEPFAGSGSQFIAAEALERNCYGLEISPHYCDVIINRYKNLTNKDVELIESVGRVANG